MLTGVEYRQSLLDGRATYFEGERVDDLPAHPILGQTVRVHRPRLRQVLRPVADGDEPAAHGAPHRPTTCAALIPMLHDAGMMAHVTSTSIRR